MKSLRGNRGILLGGSGLEEGWEGMEGGREQKEVDLEEGGKTNAVVSRMHLTHILIAVQLILSLPLHPCCRQLSAYIP